MPSQAAAEVSGACAARFATVREEFERNFAERGELGASVCVVVDGEVVVDLWGGTADEATGRPWEADTVGVIMSCSKGPMALCGNILIDRGQLDPDKPVAHYWPEFAAAGKEAIPVRMVFNHQAGLFTFGSKLPEPFGCAEWELCVRALEDTTPFWEPGTRQGYHGLAIGYLVGELVRRVTGRSIGEFLAEEISGPLGLDLWMGIPPEVEERVAPSVPFDMTQLPPDMLALVSDPSSPAAQLFANTGGWASGWDAPELHSAELPAVGAISNARGLAGMYAPLSLDGSIRGTRVISAEGISRLRNVQSASAMDVVLGHPSTYTMGVSKSWSVPMPAGGHSGVIIGEDAFGTPGLGGNMGFADQSYRLAFGYTMNRHGMGTALNDRGQALIDATYRVLGSPGNEPGYWLRDPQQSDS